MGGHGGLNILPQKRWNVYNFDNREKVKKDEEEAARKEAVEKEQARQRDAEFRLEKLREAAQAKKRDTNELRITEGEGEDAAQPALENVIEEIAGRPQHINLFGGIEVTQPELVTEKQRDGKERKSDIKEGRGRDSFTREYKKMKGQEPKVPGPEDVGYEFGFGLIGKSGKRPWYSTKGFMIGRTAGDDGAGFHAMKSRSPVKERREERPEKRRRKEKPKKHEESKKEEKPQNGRKTMEELRAERVKREQQERDKARKLVVASRKTESNGGVGVNRNSRPYYNQSFGNSR